MKKQVDQVLEFISKESHIPKDKLHLINVNAGQIQKGLTGLINNGIPIHKAVKLLKQLWLKSDPKASPATEEEMKLLGYTRTETGWYHDKAKVSVTEWDRQNHTFQYVEQVAIHGLAEQQNVSRGTE